MEPGVGQDNHLSVIVGKQGLKSSVMDVGSGAVPMGHQAQLVEHDAELAAPDWSTIRPAMVGLPFLADVTGPSAFSHRMTQFTVGHAQHGAVGQEIAGPVLLGPQPPVETGAVRQLGEQIAIVVFEPVVESSLANVLHGLQHADGDQFTDGEDGLAVVGSLGQGVIYFAEQFGDKIGDVHGVPRCRVLSTRRLQEPHDFFNVFSNQHQWLIGIIPTTRQFQINPDDADPVRGTIGQEISDTYGTSARFTNRRVRAQIRTVRIGSGAPRHTLLSVSEIPPSLNDF